MATPSKPEKPASGRNASKQNQRAVIQFLTAEGCKPVEIHQRMRAIFGEECVSKTTVNDWSRMFRGGRVETSDLPRPGQVHKVVTEKLLMDIDSAIKKNRRRSIRDLANEFDVAIDTMHNVVSDELRYRKVCCQWCPVC